MVKIRPVVVADAGPIIHLDELACLDILADFGKVGYPLKPGQNETPVAQSCIMR